ncbi:MAG TPA: hypothetical protein VK747_20150, partial [Blastocatellia bacterium]|nr:hypothetical protein [Blastocatellia bacterium]
LRSKTRNSAGLDCPNTFVTITGQTRVLSFGEDDTAGDLSIEPKYEACEWRVEFPLADFCGVRGNVPLLIYEDRLACR